MSDSDGDSILKAIKERSPAPLAPLLTAPSDVLNAAKPPLHLLPGGAVTPSRIIFTQQAQSSSSGAPQPQIKWISTNHVFPAAYPRSHPASTSPPCDLWTQAEPKPLPSNPEAAKAEERRRRQIDLKEWERREGRHAKEQFLPHTSNEDAKKGAEELVVKGQPQLWSTVERIVPVRDVGPSSTPSGEDDEGEGYVLFFAHANGLHKETWEYVLPKVIETLSQQPASEANGKKVRIDEVWSIDTIGSGESGILNRGYTGEAINWLDGARDIRQFIHHHLPAATVSSSKTRHRTVPVNPRWPPTVLPKTEARSTGPRRKLIAVGHSFSGAALSILAGAEPDLFDAIILVDPVIVPFESASGWMQNPLAEGAVARKDWWSSRRAAEEYFLSRPFYQSWDRRSLSSFVRFAVRPVQSQTPEKVDPTQLASSSAGVTLSMSKWDEAAIFTNSIYGSLGLAALQSGKYKGKICHMPSEHSVQKTGVGSSGPEAVNRIIEEQGGLVMTLEGAEHLSVQTVPDLVGTKIGEAIVKLLGEAQPPNFTPPPARL